MPTICPPGSSGAVGSSSLIKKTVVLLTVLTSIGPLNAMDRRGCRLKPSSVLMMLRSAWSDGRLAASGSGRLIRRLVSWLESVTVKRSLGKGPFAGVSRSNVAKVLGSERSSRISRRGRWVRFRVLMTKLLAEKKTACGIAKRGPSRRADRAPGRRRGGGGACLAVRHRPYFVVESAFRLPHWAAVAGDRRGYSDCTHRRRCHRHPVVEVATNRHR